MESRFWFFNSCRNDKKVDYIKCNKILNYYYNCSKIKNSTENKICQDKFNKCYKIKDFHEKNNCFINKDD